MARAVSIALHPFIVFAGLSSLGAWQLDRASFLRTMIGMAVLIAVIGLFMAQRKRSGLWTTVDASRRHERPVLYAVILLLLAAYWWWMGGGASPAAKGVAAIGAMMCTAAIANHWVKLSLHMASLSFAGLTALWLLPTAGLLALAPLPVLAWSRLRMGRHSRLETLGGVALGVVFAGMLRVW